MIGTKLYQKKSQVYFFLAMYGILSAAGIFLTAQSLKLGQTPSNAAGFMLVFGVGMLILTLVKSRKAQVSVYEEFLELDQSRSKQLLRYRNISAVSRPDKKRLVVTLREDGIKKDIVIWLKELDPADIDKLAEFLNMKKGKGR